MDLHWGTFPLSRDINGARQSAVNALRGAGLDVWAADDTEYFVTGGNDAVVVTITLTPVSAEVWTAVVAGSSDGTAERMRNLVRDLVQGNAPAPMPHL
ncbi:hypothetical protein [Amycolatopsis sp. cmx-8-4]|uniref:hypothetical protein n=1 Tax=Amycolatopsis sp. cmx-8-4 TaxID=2790947 RepID=UPI00397DCD6E